MRRLIALAAMVVPFLTLPVSMLQAQQAPAAEAAASGTSVAGQSAAGGIFPLAPVLEELQYAASVPLPCLAAWKADWPFEIPPDAFRVNSALLSGISLDCNGYSLEYRIDSRGRLEKFPIMLGGQMAQISLFYRDSDYDNSDNSSENANIEAIELIYPDISTTGTGDTGGNANRPWKFEFPGNFSLGDFRDSFPLAIRASQGGGASQGDGTSPGDTWYFIYLSGGGNENLETWYDEQGNALGIFGYTLAGIGGRWRIASIHNYADSGDASDIAFFYDSRGFLTESSGPGGVYSVSYLNEDLPRYWERRPQGDQDAGGTSGNFSLQWDANGFLVSITQEDGPVADYRYEYTLDEKGNWIERRETRMIRRFGFLVPTPGITVRRALDYNKNEF